VIPFASPSLDRQQRRLLDLFGRLSASGRESLLAFAEFLAARDGEEAGAPARPLEPRRDIPRPAQESVVAAIRRLAETYYMLERQAMLNETAGLMSAHIIQGRPARAVVDELEALFEGHYRRYLEAWDL
jgi:hypothetical protein